MRRHKFGGVRVMAARMLHRGPDTGQRDQASDTTRDHRVDRACEQAMAGPRQAGSPLGGVYLAGTAGCLPQLDKDTSQRLWQKERFGRLAGL
jgi:hypothetical protein